MELKMQKSIVMQLRSDINPSCVLDTDKVVGLGTLICGFNTMSNSTDTRRPCDIFPIYEDFALIDTFSLVCKKILSEVAIKDEYNGEDLYFELILKELDKLIDYMYGA